MKMSFAKTPKICIIYITNKTFWKQIYGQILFGKYDFYDQVSSEKYCPHL